jgi:hypothetical protein
VMKVVIGKDCGNSPKNIFIQELTIALTKGDLRSVLDRVTNDIRWNLVGDRVVQGKDPLVEALKEKKNDKTVELILDHVATHGKAGAVDGRIRFRNKNTQGFCHVYEFSNAKGNAVNEIISYIIEIKEEPA